MDVAYAPIFFPARDEASSEPIFCYQSWNASGHILVAVEGKNITWKEVRRKPHACEDDDLNAMAVPAETDGTATVTATFINRRGTHVVEAEVETFLPPPPFTLTIENSWISSCFVVNFFDADNFEKKGVGVERSVSAKAIEHLGEALAQLEANEYYVQAFVLGDCRDPYEDAIDRATIHLSSNDEKLSVYLSSTANLHLSKEP